MKSIALAATAALALTLSSAPARAAEDMRSISDQGRRTGAFAGATVRLPIGGKPGAKPTARLQLGIIDRTRGTRPIPAGGLELGLTAKGKAEMFVGGRSSREMREQMKLTRSTALVLGGVVAVTMIAVVYLATKDLDEVGDSIPTF